MKRRRRGWSPDNHAYQHRSPDPTKIERATATSTVALFFYFSYFYKDLDKHVLRNFSRFRLRAAHHLREESCKWHGGSSICDKCECGEVHSMCFSFAAVHSKCAEVCELRMRYRDLFEGCLRLCVRLLLRALNLFLFWLVTVSLILRSMPS